MQTYSTLSLQWHFFSQFSAAVVRHKPNDGLVYAIRAWLSTGTALTEAL